MTTDTVDGGSTVCLAGVYEAAMTGSVATLDTLLERYGRAILHRVSLTSLVETPLHLAALLGHLEFSKRLLELIPDLALEQDSDKCTPLHLSAAKGHDQVVRELLKGVGEKACLVQDQEGRTPLHLAAMRGRVQVVRELLNSKHAQQAVKMKVEDGDSVLHLCVKHNHLDVLKVVVDSTMDDREILKMTDSRGNTVLHLAVMLKHKATVRYLVGLPRVQKEVINTSNEMDFTAMDVLNHSPKDFKSQEIHEILVGGAARDRRRIRKGEVEVAEEQEQIVVKASTWWEQAWHYVKGASHYVTRPLQNYRGDWMDETKGSLMMVSTIIATVTFTAGITPPGGVWQEDTKSDILHHPCNDTLCVAGNALLAYYYPDTYSDFMQYNMVSFFGSLVVVFLLISGFPLHNKFCLWILSLVMCLTVSFLGLTFLKALWLVVPDVPEKLLNQYMASKTAAQVVWYIMVGICGVCLLIRLSSWLQRVRMPHCLKTAFSSMPKLLQVNRYACWTNRQAQAETSRC